MKVLRYFLLLLLLHNIALIKANHSISSDSNKIVKQYQLNIAKVENRNMDYWLKAGGVNPTGESLNVNALYWVKNNKPWLPVMGEFHYLRFPRSGWEDQLLKMKAAGISIVSTYVFWVNTEQPKGSWNWSGDNDLRYFIQLCQQHGLYVWLRPGPYINAESKNGGLPDWVNKSGKRSDAPWYLEEVKKYYAQVAEQTKGLFYKDGGPIIGLQVDNEFAHGDAQHLSTLLHIANELGMVAPFNTCTSNSKYNYPLGNMLPMQGAYPYRGWDAPEPTSDFLYSSDEWNAMENIGGLPYDGNRFPRGMAELGVGCWQNYWQRFIVPVYDSEAHFQNCIGRGVNLPGYYMFQGGTQKSGFEGDGHPLTYDFQAPLGEYGQVRPSYRALKLIHYFLSDFGSQLATMQPLRPDSMVINPKDVSHLRYVGRFNKDSGYLFLNNAQCWVDMKPQENIQFKLNLSTETLIFPQRPFTLQPNLSPIFPVNMNLNGSLLKYATAQLLCKVESEQVPYYFFFTVDGIEPEFAFDNASTSKISSKSEIVNVNGWSIATLHTSLEKAVTVTSKLGKKAIIVLLTRAQAEQSWRFNFRGQERLMLSDANLLLDGNTLEISSKKGSAVLTCFPELKTSFSKENVKKQGVFSHHFLKFDQPKVEFKTTQHSAQEIIFYTFTSLIGIKDIFVNVDYIGSTAEISVDGVKYSDDRYNGKGWDIGLKRFIDGKPHEIKIVAQKWDEGVKGIAPQYTPKNENERKGIIRSLHFEPEYFIRTN